MIADSESQQEQSAKSIYRTLQTPYDEMHVKLPAHCHHCHKGSSTVCLLSSTGLKPVLSIAVKQPKSSLLWQSVLLKLLSNIMRHSNLKALWSDVNLSIPLICYNLLTFGFRRLQVFITLMFRNVGSAKFLMFLKSRMLSVC